MIALVFIFTLSMKGEKEGLSITYYEDITTTKASTHQYRTDFEEDAKYFKLKFTIKNKEKETVTAVLDDGMYEWIWGDGNYCDPYFSDLTPNELHACQTLSSVVRNAWGYKSYNSPDNPKKVLAPDESYTFETDYMEIEVFKALPQPVHFEMQAWMENPSRNPADYLLSSDTLDIIFQKYHGYLDGDFLFEYHYPIYNADKIGDYNDFKEKCFVGECTGGNIRHVICMDDDNSIDAFQYNCDDSTSVSPIPNYCTKVRNKKTGETIIKSSCSFPEEINFYYIWNDWQTGYIYSGYNPDWQERYEGFMKELNKRLAPFNLHIDANYYEHKVPNTGHPCYVFGLVDESVSVFRPADKHITICSGLVKYDRACGGQPSQNPCQAFQVGDKIRIPEFYNYDVLAHELGHTWGCEHPSQSGSLSDELWYGGFMSWMRSEYNYLYECRIILYLLGQNK